MTFRGSTILRNYGLTAGLVMLLPAVILYGLAPQERIWALVIAAAGVALAVAGALADRERVTALLTGRRGKEAGASLGYTAVVLTVLLLVNFLAGRHHRRFDLTEDRLFSLSEQTVKVLEGLPREVRITAFLRSSEPSRQRLEDLLDEYTYRSDRLKVQFIDPDTSPAAVRSYNVTEYGTVVLESGEREARLTSVDEESLTNALIDVTGDRERILYFTTGHGERGLEDGERQGLTLLKGALEKQHYTVRPLVLNQGVPDDATAVVIAGSRKRFLDTEVAMIAGYLDGGGRVLLMEDPEDDAGLGKILAGYGVALRDDVVIDKISQLFGGDVFVPLVPADGYDRSHAVTKNFDYQTFYPMARSIDVKSELPDRVQVTPLARTSDFSWGETSADELKGGTIRMDEGKDVAGPLTLAAAIVRTRPASGDATKPGEESAPKPEDGSDAGSASGETKEAGEKEAAAPPPEPPTRLLVFGDSDFTSNAYFNASGNGDLVLNGLAWLSEQGELVSIRPKQTTPRAVVLTAQQAIFYAVTIVGMIPLAIVVTGVGIWWRRRKL